MEKITIRSTYSEVSLYARWTASAAGKAIPAGDKPPANPDDGGAAAKTQSPEKGVTARNADGDTFTLSVEARAIQVTETVTVESGSACGKPEGPAGPSRADRLDALMEALDRKHAHGDRRHRYPDLIDPDDVADRAAEDWDREFAGRSGSRRDFAGSVRARLDRWASGGGEARAIRAEHRAFRSEVAVQIGARLETWVGSGEPDGDISSRPDPE
jgi:hypothetical protein